MKKLFSTILLMVLLSITATAQRLEYQGGYGTGGDKFQLVYQFSGAGGPGSFTAPTVEGAKKIYQSSPQKMGESSSVVVINGKVVENSSGGMYRYTVTYKAEKTGRLKVGAASVTYNGRRYSAPGVSISVGGSQPQRTAPTSAYNQLTQGPVEADNPFSQTTDKPIGKDDIFVRIEMSKPRVYEQQAVVCTIKLYTLFPIKDFTPLKQSEFNGFLIEDITPKMNGTPVVERYNGKNYYTATLRKCILYPQKSGTLNINSGEFDVVPVKREVFMGLNSAIAVPVEGNKLRIKSNAASVKIEPLPEPRPAGFTGAVGEFSVKTAINPAALKTYATATYSVVVSGSGNIKYIKAPTITFPKEFDVYDPQNKINVSAEGNDVHGDVTFNYQFIPQYVGQFTIPASDFVYFNPTTGKYETIHLSEQKLDVAKGNGQPSSHYKQQQDAMTDIYALHDGDLDLSKTHTYYVASALYWLWFIVPFLAMCGILIYYRKLVRERADVKFMRSKRASKVARRRLKQAQKFMAAGKKSDFYAEVLSAMWGYLSDKLGIPRSELSKDNIANELEAYGVDETLRNSTLALLDKCEFAQYAPELEGSDMASVYKEAATTMDSLQNVKRKKTAQS